MKKKYKIAVYSGSIPSTTFIERLIHGLSKNGCQIYLFGVLQQSVSYGSSISSFAYKNSKLNKLWCLLKYGVGLVLFKFKEKRKLDAILKLRHQNSLLDKMKCYPVLWHKPDVFHVQWAKSIDYWSWVKEFNVKLVLSFRGAHINYSPISDKELAAMYRRVFPKVDRFHAVSKAMSSEAQKYGADPDKIDVVYSGLDVHAFKRSLNLKTSTFNIISVGRSHWIKGYHYALDACKILKDNNVSFRYTIVGAKGYLELMYQIKDLGLENHVVLEQALPIEDVKHKISEASLLILPSIKEGIANVVLEAMASRTLVLATNCGGIEEVIENEVNGFLCPIRNANKIAECVLDIIKLSDTDRELILDNAQNTIDAQHTEEQMIDNMIDLYKKTLNH